MCSSTAVHGGSTLSSIKGRGTSLAQSAGEETEALQTTDRAAWSIVTGLLFPIPDLIFGTHSTP